MPDVFLSYSREDQATARRFAEGLERAGFSVWWDQALSAGEAFDEVTEKALQDARAVVVLWSKSSVASRWVRAESSQADENGTLVPVMIEACNLPMKFRLTHAADLTQWKGDDADAAWQSFLTGLRRPAGNGAPERAPADASSPARHTRSATRQWNPWLVIACGLAALLVLGGGYWLLGHRATAPSPGKAGIAATPDRAAATTIAVLPFADLSTDAGQELFVDGLTEEIINALAQLGGLEVTGRTSSFQFKGRNENLKAIGEQLGVQYLLEGSVRRSGDRLKITAQLIKADDGFHLWSRPYDYDRPMSDLIAFQEDIARKVAEALQITLGVGDLGRTQGMTRKVEAYRLWLEGNALISKDRGQAIARYEAALALDPSFALAWASLEDTAAFESIVAGRPLDPRVAEARAQVGRLLPDSALYHLGEAGWAQERFAWQDAEQHLRRARAAGGHAQDVMLGFLESTFLLTTDRGDKAHDLALRAYQRDPLNVAVVMNLAFSYFLHSGDYDRARELLREARALDPQAQVSNMEFGIALLQENRAAIDALFGASIEANPAFDARGIQQAMRPLLDRPAEARTLLRDRLPLADSLFELRSIMLWSGYFGDPVLSLEALRKISAINPGRGRALGQLMWGSHAWMRSVRALPGFKDLVREMNLVDYWRQNGWGEHCRPVGDDDFECS